MDTMGACRVGLHRSGPFQTSLFESNLLPTSPSVQDCLGDNLSSDPYIPSLSNISHALLFLLCCPLYPLDISNDRCASILNHPQLPLLLEPYY